MLTILFYHARSFVFLFFDLYFLIPAVITQIFNPIAVLVIPIRITTKEAKAEMKTHPVTVKMSISERSIQSKTLQFFGASYSLIHFDLFL